MNCKAIICIAVLLLSVSVYGQKENTSNDVNATQAKSLNGSDNNELRINLMMAILGLPELNYERYISDNMGVGLAVAVSLDKVENVSTRYLFTPFYRLYFGNKKASGFFIEGNMAMAGQKQTINNTYYDQNGVAYQTVVSTRSTTNIGFGAAIGAKFLARNGFIGEVFVGGGRLFGESIDQAYPRVGICLGKRF